MDISSIKICVFLLHPINMDHLTWSIWPHGTLYVTSVHLLTTLNDPHQNRVNFLEVPTVYLGKYTYTSSLTANISYFNFWPYSVFWRNIAWSKFLLTNLWASSRSFLSSRAHVTFTEQTNISTVLSGQTKPLPLLYSTVTAYIRYIGCPFKWFHDSSYMHIKCNTHSIYRTRSRYITPLSKKPHLET